MQSLAGVFCSSGHFLALIRQKESNRKEEPGSMCQLSGVNVCDGVNLQQDAAATSAGGQLRKSQRSSRTGNDVSPSAATNDVH